VDSEDLAWVRGALRSRSEATVSLGSPTAQFGLNAFEGIRCYWNPPLGQLFVFRLQDHIERLFQSCRVMEIPLPYKAEDVADIVVSTLRANELREDAAVRLIAYVDGEGSWHSTEPADLVAFTSPRARLSEVVAHGVRACVSSWRRINDSSMPPRVKAGANYVNSRYALLEARRNGFDVPILLGADAKVSESSGACVVLIRDGVVVTPPGTASVLESITTTTVLSLCADMGFPVDVRPVDRTELYLAEEVFLCGSAAELTPVVSIDGHPVGAGVPGVNVSRLLQEYHHAADGSRDDQRGWLKAVYPEIPVTS